MPSHIYISLSNRSLHLYQDEQLVNEYPVGIGKPETPTPIGQYNIIEKIDNPPEGMGSRWMRLSVINSCIHGTNEPSSIGGLVSGGCIRMHNKDIEELFGKVEVNTPVTINP